MTRPPGCQAVRQQDEWNCARCRLVWSVNDPDPPECSPVTDPPSCPSSRDKGETTPGYGAQTLKNIQDRLKAS